MAHELKCWRCGKSLADLSLPLRREEVCSSCSSYLTVCKMCVHFDTLVAKACREDDADEVKEKERPNFCDYFAPSASAFDPVRAASAQQASNELAALFGDESDGKADSGDALSDADKLFKD